MLRLRTILAGAALLAVSNAAMGQVPGSPGSQQLVNITAPDAASLIGALKEAQLQLKAGTPLNFELLSGATASSPEADIPPRAAFLGLALDRVWQLERVESSNPLHRPFRLIVPVNGLGRPMWYIEVVLGPRDQIERVEMLWKAPPPI